MTMHQMELKRTGILVHSNLCSHTVSYSAYQENVKSTMVTITRLMTGEINLMMDGYLVNGYLRLHDIYIPTDIVLIVKQFIGDIDSVGNSLYLSPLGVNWWNMDATELSERFIKVIGANTTNIGWKCIFIEKYRSRWCETTDTRYLWWFIENANRNDNASDAIVLKFSLRRIYPEDSFSSC